MSGSLIRPFHPTVVLGFSLRRVSALYKRNVQTIGPPTSSRPSRPVIHVVQVVQILPAVHASGTQAVPALSADLGPLTSKLS
jgi:hypothetical protein